jgi:hypothetical protein
LDYLNKKILYFCGNINWGSRDYRFDFDVLHLGPPKSVLQKNTKAGCSSNGQKLSTTKGPVMDGASEGLRLHDFAFIALK